jgi:diketogulonate reductase-like aldo/keto reductase
VKQKEFGVKGPEVRIIGPGTWYIDRGYYKGAVAALRRGIELGIRGCVSDGLQQPRRRFAGALGKP